jgi:hypothetical protein
MNREQALELIKELMGANFDVLAEQDVDDWSVNILKEDFYSDRLAWVNKFVKQHKLGGYVIRNNMLKFIDGENEGKTQ